MPIKFFEFCDKEKLLDYVGEEIYKVVNTKFNLGWPATTRGYRVALWAVIGDRPSIRLEATTEEGKFRTLPTINLLIY
jgi:hypothetical protein